MPNWVTVTTSNVRLLDSEQAVMFNVGAVEDLPACIESAAHFARGYIAGGGNQLEAAPTVPKEVVDDVCAIARASYLAQEPSGTLLTEIRQKERDNAVSHLRDIAKGVASITAAEVLNPPPALGGDWGSAPKITMSTEL